MKHLPQAATEPFQRAASHTVTHQLYRQPRAQCVGGEAVARLQDRKQAGWGGGCSKLRGLSQEGSPSSFVSCWFKLFQDTSTLGNGFGQEEYAEFTSSRAGKDPTYNTGSSEGHGLRNGPGLTFLSKCPHLSLRFLIYKLGCCEDRTRQSM